LRDEPYWQALAQLVDWAEECTHATVWSCLAAHAAVLHTDGIGRRALPRKLSGLYECRRIADHALVRGMPRRWWVSHSRCNDVPAAALNAHGYRTLSWSPQAGADLFIRQRQSLFVYFQGHPEYDPDSLAREYRRDVGRFLAGERDLYPDLPYGYFDAAATEALQALQQQALRERSLGLLERYPAAALAAPAHASADVAVYRRWLGFIAAAKDWRDAAALPGEVLPRSDGGSR
jgi:homoserine O-succinyltransferase/O-acetyltransferase